MITEINKQGMLIVITETEYEKSILQKWIENNVINSKEFTNCCGNKKCSFKIELKDEPKMIERKCFICKKSFLTNVTYVRTCPSCYI